MSGLKNIVSVVQVSYVEPVCKSHRQIAPMPSEFSAASSLLTFPELGAALS